IHYLLCRADADGERLSRVLYDLGNAVLKQAGDNDADLLRRAIGFYEECLRQENANPELLDNTQHNLKLARELLQKAKLTKKEDNPREAGKIPPEQENPGVENNASRTGAGSGIEDPGVGGQQGSPQQPGDSQSAAARQPRGGIGNLPPIPDADQMIPLSS